MADRVALNNIKTQLKSIFDAANTTTASPIDLSSDLTTRVQKVLTVHPNLIPVQASYWPFVSCYVESKDPNAGTDIAGDQLQAKRKGKVKIFVVGGFYNENFVTDTKDPADDDINYLMENIELVLRGNPTLKLTVKWQKPVDVKYMVAPMSEQTHIRVGNLGTSKL